MSSEQLSVERISLINRLVQNMSLHEPAPDHLAQLDAADFAAKRNRSARMDESELRAIIYDRLYPASRSNRGAPNVS